MIQASRNKAGLGVAAVLSFALSAIGQDVPSAPAPFRATTTLILVPTLVKSATGALIRGLAADDFRLTDNGAR